MVGSRPAARVVGGRRAPRRRRGPMSLRRARRPRFKPSPAARRPTARSCSNRDNACSSAKLDLPTGASGSLDVRVRLTSEEGGGTPLSASFASTSTRPSQSPSCSAVVRRPGPHFLPAPDPVFSRTERLRLEFPVGPGPRDGKAGSGRVLDRAARRRRSGGGVRANRCRKAASDGLPLTRPGRAEPAGLRG